MKQTITRSDLPANHPFNVVSRLLHEKEGTARSRQLEPMTVRAVTALERREPEIVRAARDVGVDIVPLGINPLFQEPRFYEGQETDWVLGPAERNDDAIVPRREGRELKRLQEAGLNPLVYIAHEIPQDKTAELRAAAAEGKRELSPAKAAELVGPVPPPADSMALAERLGHRTNQVVNGAKRTAQVAGVAAAAAVAAPVAIIGGAIASLATLDPVVIGAMPAISERPGAPAAWYILTRWDW